MKLSELNPRIIPCSFVHIDTAETVTYLEVSMDCPRCKTSRIFITCNRSDNHGSAWQLTGDYTNPDTVSVTPSIWNHSHRVKEFVGDEWDRKLVLCDAHFHVINGQAVLY